MGNVHTCHVFYIAKYSIFLYSTEQKGGRIMWHAHTYKTKIVYKILAVKHEEKRHLRELPTGGIDQGKTYFGY
jgi:hypothetical protein